MAQFDIAHSPRFAAARVVAAVAGSLVLLLAVMLVIRPEMAAHMMAPWHGLILAFGL